jgi:hypothetical protein
VDADNCVAVNAAVIILEFTRLAVFSVDPVNVENVALPITHVDTRIDDTCTSFVGTNRPPVDVVST